MTNKEKRKQRIMLRRAQRAAERRRFKNELRAEQAKYRRPRKRPTTSKLALSYIFGCATVVQLYSMFAMWHFGDLSAMASLIGATVGEAIAYCAYTAKSTKENTAGGITYEMAMADRLNTPASDPTPPAKEADDTTTDDAPCG